MFRIKIIYNPLYIVNNIEVLQDKIVDLKNSYGKNFIIEKSKEVNFTFYINGKIVYTVDDSFSIEKVPTEILISKIDQHIYNVKASKREKQSGRFDDVDIIDY